MRVALFLLAALFLVPVVSAENQLSANLATSSLAGTNQHGTLPNGPGRADLSYVRQTNYGGAGTCGHPVAGSCGWWASCAPCSVYDQVAGPNTQAYLTSSSLPVSYQLQAGSMADPSCSGSDGSDGFTQWTFSNFSYAYSPPRPSFTFTNLILDMTPAANLTDGGNVCVALWATDPSGSGFDKVWEHDGFSPSVRYTVNQSVVLPDIGPAAGASQYVGAPTVLIVISHLDANFAPVWMSVSDVEGFAGAAPPPPPPGPGPPGSILSWDFVYAVGTVIGPLAAVAMLTTLSWGMARFMRERF